jgi:glycosyltransferase 2 family protein
MADSVPPQQPGGSRKKIARMIILVIAIGLVVNVFTSLFVDPKRFVEAISRISLLGIVVPFLCVLLPYLLDAFRYKLVLRPYGYKISVAQGFYNNLMGSYFCNLTPLAAGGQPFQIYHLHTLGVDSKTATNIVVMRYLEFTVSCLLGMFIFSKRAIQIALSSNIGAFVIFLGIATSLVITLIILFAMFNPHLLGRFSIWVEQRLLGRFIGKIAKKPYWAEQVYTWCMDLKENVRHLWKNNLHIIAIDFLLNIGDVMLGAYALYFAATLFQPLNALHPVAYTDILILTFVSNFVVHYIPIPGASGTIETLYNILLGVLFANAGAAISTTVTWRFSTYYLNILLGSLFFFFYVPKKQPAQRGILDFSRIKGKAKSNSDIKEN